jgi:hypothetical protein
VQAGIEASGVTLPYHAVSLFWKLPEARRQAAAGNREPMQDLMRTFVRSGLGMTVATVVAASIDPEDFVGEYDSVDANGRAIARAKNAPHNAVRIGGKWVSLDYFGPIAAPLIGLLYAKKYGDSLPDKAVKYFQGASQTLLRLPGISEVKELITEGHEVLNEKEPGKVGEDATDAAIGYLRASVVPGFVSDIAKGTDAYQRETGRSAVSKAQAGIPVLREMLPTKTDQTTGKAKKTEGIFSELLFGSRVSTAHESKVITEISRLYKADEAPSIADITRTPSMKNLQAQIPQKEFQSAVRDFGEQFGDHAADLIESGEYDAMTDEEKKRAFDKVRHEALQIVLEDYGYEKPEKD